MPQKCLFLYLISNHLEQGGHDAFVDQTFAIGIAALICGQRGLSTKGTSETAAGKTSANGRNS
jgi:hypothetical protein